MVRALMCVLRKYAFENICSMWEYVQPVLTYAWQ